MMKKVSKDVSHVETLPIQNKVQLPVNVMELTEHLEKVIIHVDVRQDTYLEKLMELFRKIRAVMKIAFRQSLTDVI